jgi:rare lipoprotein A
MRPPPAAVVDVPLGEPVPGTADAVQRISPGGAGVPELPVLAVAEGEATYYADMFDGRRTASGLVFRNAEAFAAHRAYPFGTLLRVVNLRNHRSAIVTVVDRGPHGTSERARRTIIDVSQSIAEELDFIRDGRVPVRLEVLHLGGSR